MATAGVTFSASAAAKIKKATERVLNSPQSRTGDRTGRTASEESFWAIITGRDVTGQHFHFLRCQMNLDTDSRDDFKLTNGVGYIIVGDEPDFGIGREANGNRAVPTYTVTRMFFNGYDRDNLPAYIFVSDDDGTEADLRLHDHRDNFNGGFAFACYHPGTGLPQQPWAQ